METSSELKRICKHIAQNKLTEDQIYDLLEKYQSKLYKFAWERGWRIKSRAVERSREAHREAERKIQDCEQEKTEDPPEPLDFNKVIKKGVLIPLSNGDEKPVEFLQPGDQIIYNEEVKEIKNITPVKLRWQVKTAPHIYLTEDKIMINTKRGTMVESIINKYRVGYYFGGNFVEVQDVDNYLEPYKGKQKDDYIVYLK